MNRILLYILLPGLLWFATVEWSAAQLSGNSLSEYQLGNIPDTDPEDLSSLYNQLNLRYRQKGLTVSTRLEQFYTNDSIDRKYIKPTQWQVSYRHKKFELKAGHFFETLGRGLLFRSFEIPASIKEERTFRVRHGFYRDIQGAMFKYRGKIFHVKALYGKPLQNSYPPGNDFQRVETVEAIQPEIKLWKQNLGFVAMRHSSQGSKQVFSSVFLKGILPLNFTYYGEYARNLSTDYNPLSFDDEDGYAAYLSLNHSYGNYGSSIELKSYNNFLIGTGITDPPTLVKEHSYRLLNRSTHLTELISERGYQVDVFYAFEDDKMISFNHSRGVNEVFDRLMFQEFFLEFYWPFSDGSSLKSFADYSSEELLRDKHRYAAGVYYTQVIKDAWSASLETEWQTIVPESENRDNSTNIYLGLIVSNSTKLSLSLYYEYSTDPVIADRSSTPELETSRHFYGLGVNYRPNPSNSLSAFIGERRGGPACVSGVCYEVLDFRGLELRWTTKFKQ